MSLGCARCGDCCDPVILETATFFGCRERAQSEESPSANDRFIAEHWHPIGSWTAEDGTDCMSLRCDAFDPERRTCTAYDDRPPVCGNYPWYGDGPGAERAAPLPPRCSFLADIPPVDRPEGSRPLIPLMPVGV